MTSISRRLSEEQAECRQDVGREAHATHRGRQPLDHSAARRGRELAGHGGRSGEHGHVVARGQVLGDARGLQFGAANAVWRQPRHQNRDVHAGLTPAARWPDTRSARTAS
jgi:hypothetical protein